MSFLKPVKSWLEKGAVLFMRTLGGDYFYSLEEMYTPRGWLKLLDKMGNYLAFGFFSGIAWTKWQHISCFGILPFKQKAGCFFPAVLPCATVLIIGSVFYLSRRSANKELAIAEKVFPQGRLPREWLLPADRTEITIRVVFFFAGYVTLGWISDYIKIVAPVMACIACNDFRTLRVIKAKSEEYFRAAEYAPVPGEEDYDNISRRRVIVREYYYAHPQELKEMARIAGCVAGFFFALKGFRSTAYVLIILTLILNEIITFIWRLKRDRSWLALQAPTRRDGTQMGKAGTA